MPLDPLTREESLQAVIDRFWEAVPPAWSRVRSQLRDTACQQHGITVEQFHVLRHIRKGAGSISDLATQKRISRSAISQAIDGLVSLGLVTRTENTTDRRFVTVALTERGDALLNAIHHSNRIWLLARLSALSDEEIGTLQRGLEILNKSINTPE
jgi:DNA-binding MarR family transcriptional regulator